ncbi:hypothetical protein TASIC1_0017003500 [Trichoderma asperellum]|uniref:Alpha/beta hydrolase domain-containing protein n=1 Tax=Trichoderma asperellum TaxID=101201 RepID=A0A6V8RCB7_TRIAP|nr:hypothetical protein TASIC1_0017003500 [Trichoderma asperellum]
MAVGKTQPAEERVPEPQITHLPDGETSQPVVLEPYHVDLLPEYGYVSREYLMSGVAAGHAWLEVDSQSPSAIGKIKNLDPERYKNMHFIPGPLADEFMDTIPFMTAVTREMLEQSYVDFKEKWWPATTQSPEIITAASYALRSGELGIAATRVILTGLSQTGGVTRRFITHSSHLRLPDGGLPFEAFIPCQSGGAALPDVPGAKIIELLGESEFQSVRLPCGVSGQILGVSHRRADSNSFRLYEIAGMAHRESRYPSDIDVKRWSVADLNGAKWSTFPNSFIYHAVFDAMERWTSNDAIAPPCSSVIQTIGLSDEIVRDEHGNAVGGGRPNWYCGSEWDFAPELLQKLYGTVANYRRLAGLAISKQIRAGFLLREDAELLRRETIESVVF